MEVGRVVRLPRGYPHQVMPRITGAHLPPAKIYKQTKSCPYSAVQVAGDTAVSEDEPDGKL